MINNMKQLEELHNLARLREENLTKGFIENDLEKAKYKNNRENQKKGRVGQEWGGKHSHEKSTKHDEQHIISNISIDRNNVGMIPSQLLEMKKIKTVQDSVVKSLNQITNKQDSLSLLHDANSFQDSINKKVDKLSEQAEVLNDSKELYNTINTFLQDKNISLVDPEVWRSVVGSKTSKPISHEDVLEINNRLKSKDIGFQLETTGKSLSHLVPKKTK